MLSFDMAESLVVWEAWIKNICGQSKSADIQAKDLFSNLLLHAAQKDTTCMEMYTRPAQRGSMSCKGGFSVINFFSQTSLGRSARNNL